jgi:hypothetical protein
VVVGGVVVVVAPVVGRWFLPCIRMSETTLITNDMSMDVGGKL